MAQMDRNKEVRGLMITFPNAHLMLVNGCSLLRKYKVTKCQSSVFERFGYKWKLIVYPHGKNNQVDHISVYLKIEETPTLPANWVVKADFTLLVRRDCLSWMPFYFTDTIFNSSNRMHGEENCAFHRSFFCKTTEYLENDGAIFGVDIMKFQKHGPGLILKSVGTAERLRLIEKPSNSKFTWKITKFSTFKQAQHFSYDFVVGQRKWRIQMHPEGVGDAKGDWFSVFLTVGEYLGDVPKVKTLAKFKLRLLDQLYQKHIEMEDCYLFGPPGNGFGRVEFMRLEELHDESNGFLVNDSMYVNVEFQLVSVTTSFAD